MSKKTNIFYFNESQWDGTWIDFLVEIAIDNKRITCIIELMEFTDVDYKYMYDIVTLYIWLTVLQKPSLHSLNFYENIIKMII